jgi:hypothetical protein
MKRLWKRIALFAIANMIALAAPVHAQTDERLTEIAQHCSAKWGADYDMQVYCRRKHTDALDKLSELVAVWSQDKERYRAEWNILAACDQKWGAEFDMTLYCVGKQMTARNELLKQDRRQQPDIRNAGQPR